MRYVVLMKRLAVLAMSTAFLCSCGNSGNPSSSPISSSPEATSSKEETTAVVSSATSSMTSSFTSSEKEIEPSLESEDSELVTEEERSSDEVLPSEASMQIESSEESFIEQSSEATLSSEATPVEYEIEESVWNSIINDGLMTNTDSNFTCVMNKSMKDIENTSTSTFYVDYGNLQRSYPASYDLTKTITEYFGLLEWGNPSSKYNYYTYNRLEEKWEYQELNSKFLHFYRDDLGIVIDLAFSDLSYNEEKHCYSCGHKKSYPFDSPYTSRNYDDIEIYFENNLLKKITYDSDGALWSFDYSNYGTTDVDLPIVTAL